MGKGLKGLIKEKKSEIIKKWFEAAIQTYAPDTAQFFQNQKDQFANPVGSITFKGIGFLLDQLLNDMDPAAIKSYLDPIIRVRAVQDFTPSQATAFILSLKKIIRVSLGKQLQDTAKKLELFEFESQIDQLCLMAFDIYVACKEKIYQISANETRNQTFRAFQRAGLINDGSEKPKKLKSVDL